ncbi:UDP-glucose 4-epimerase [Paraburkholderia eburnea]|uniref:UDP-glucose 4-epimerase n=1 Tax=Paraburkholderia eburnea TaxID=1189126 RepID=A0A2S4MMN6_9BURK|nr:NAD-dependent epimerase/dehydratase family protein [Paraburkholderia eburnea]POR55905.1 UDP-glucose 4-epimerase [Paraburkholderia eburnea]PRZ27032.1 UDP-glucose 4-epimerase [Paraburkholderia eburnea]
MRIAISGANGFVGRALSAALCEAGHEVTGLVRRANVCEGRVREVVVADDNFQSLATGAPAFGPCDVLVHLAARVHMMKESLDDPLAAYRAVNVDGALNAAEAARRAGARRVVFMSSIKALGETEQGRPWREDDEPAPVDPYGISKREAELALDTWGRAHGVEVASVRAPLVYGPGVRANFLGLMKAVERGIPLPLGAIDARRSMVYVRNLADALAALCVSARAVHGVYHVSDGDDLSVGGIVRALATASGRRPRLVPVPVSWLRALGRLTGKSAQIQRLTSPLRLECVRLRDELGWAPSSSVSDGIKATMLAFHEGR